MLNGDGSSGARRHCGRNRTRCGAGARPATVRVAQRVRSAGARTARDSPGVDTLAISEKRSTEVDGRRQTMEQVCLSSLLGANKAQKLRGDRAGRNVAPPRACGRFDMKRLPFGHALGMSAQ